MSETTVRKTFKEKLRPTPEQERAFDAVLWRCRDLYNTALEQGRNRFHSFTFKEYGNGATLDNGFLVLSKIGGISCTGRAHLREHPRPSPF